MIDRNKSKIDKDSRFITPKKKPLHIRSKSKEELDQLFIDHCIELKKDLKFEKSKEKDRNIMLKRCEICKDFINRSQLLFCHYCQDAYHSYCINGKIINISKAADKPLVCPRCIEENKHQFRQLTVDQLFLNKKTSRTSPIKLVKCNKCNLEIDSKGKLNCERCHHIFHPKCFNSQKEKDNAKGRKGFLKQKIICNDCEVKVNADLKVTKINDYFKNAKPVRNKSIKDIKEKDKIDNDDVIVLSKISKEILVDKPMSNEGRIRLPKALSKAKKEIMMKSLFRALTVKGITFNDDLVFLDPDCPQEMNNAYHEPGINVISDYNKKIYYSFKERSRKGEYAPVEVIDDPIQRFIVRAVDDISMNTIITEYTGEVTLLRKKIFDPNDSIMELIRTPSSSNSIVICPELYGNLARFLSGINNYDEKLKKKQNVYSLRFNIDGTVHILLLAMKNIKKGDILYYDYNAGGYDEYPTEHFI